MLNLRFEREEVAINRRLRDTFVVCFKAREVANESNGVCS